MTNSIHPHVPCCVSGDYCLSNSICLGTNSKNESFYYTADCTDQTLTDPACVPRCGGRNSAFITYTDKGSWACCENTSTGAVNCSDPSDEVYPGPAPSKLVTVQFLLASGTPTYVVQATLAETGSSSSIGSSSATESSSSGLGVGPAAMIGVFATAGLVLVVTAVALCFLRVRVTRRRPATIKQSHSGYEDSSSMLAARVGPRFISGSAARPVYELDKTGPSHHELDSNTVL
ncbi:uncharacterized protein CDV56_104100 [Aspergillus thermomutatus]|uniref:Mid2 domain-containing protein n=1 Tax=Aspergillus thermomutatus TaxID=41047 RepID=A0A397GIE2_ASPTH|nr:uncharacterized protein CDV56_104100 [Aspergillus thermomutatus]RHZ47800.1 hypothetical protein CDV56_104100 [Aspergillus thermomutatus]